MPPPDITKRYLAETMLKLAEKESFDKITVADLAQYAGINRKTFYYHFKDKFDLLAWFFQDAFEICRRKEEPTDFWSFYVVLATCMNKYRPLYKNILIGKDKDYFGDFLKRFLRPHMVRYVPAARLEDIVGDKYNECIDFLCTTFIASLEEWLVNWPHLTVVDFIRVSQFDKIL